MDPKKLQSKKPHVGTNLKAIKIALPSLPEKLAVEKTLTQVITESDVFAKSKGESIVPSAKGTPIIAVVEGKADVISSDGEYAEGVEIIVAAAAADFDELSHQIRSEKTVTIGTKKYIPALTGIFYAMLVTLSCAEASTFDSQEISIFTQPTSDSVNPETYTFEVQPKTRICKLLVLSSRMINSSRVLFPSKFDSQFVASSEVKACAEVSGDNCTITFTPLTPSGLKKVL